MSPDPQKQYYEKKLTNSPSDEKEETKKEKHKTDTLSDTSDEDFQEINQLEQENLFLKHTIMTQTNQIGELYLKINYLQEKEDEQQERVKAFEKFDGYVKRMRKITEKWRQFGNFKSIIVVTIYLFLIKQPRHSRRNPYQPSQIWANQTIPEPLQANKEKPKESLQKDRRASGVNAQ